MAPSCCFLNSSKSRTLFAASSMLSPLNKSSSGSSYIIVSRSSSFTKNVFLGVFPSFCIFARSFWRLFLCFFYSQNSFFSFLLARLLDFLKNFQSLVFYLQLQLYFLLEINLLEVHYSQSCLGLQVFFIYQVRFFGLFILLYFCKIFLAVILVLFLAAEFFMSSMIFMFSVFFFFSFASTIFLNVFSRLMLSYFLIIFLAASLPDLLGFSLEIGTFTSP